MAFTRLTNDLAIIAALADLPNSTSGLTAAQLKAKFDEAAGIIKVYLNNTLAAELEATTAGDSGAHNIGSAPVAGVVGSTVYDQISNLKTQIAALIMDTNPAFLSRQILINPNFDIAKRGTTFAISTGGQYTLDRWFARRNSGLTGCTVSRQTGDLSRYCIRLQRDAGDTQANYLWASQIIETANTIPLRSKQVTISFRARKGANYSQAGSQIQVNLFSGPDVDGTFSGSSGAIVGASTVASVTAVLTTTWQSFSATGTIGAAENLLSVRIRTRGDDNTDFVGTAGAADWVDVEQIQVTEGAVVLPFQARQVAQEEVLAERYCQVIKDATNTGVPVGYGSAISTTVAHIQVRLNDMRIVPTLTATATDWQLSDGVTATDLTAISILANGASTNTVTLVCTVASGLTQFRPYKLIADGTAGRLMRFEAEL